MCPLNLSIYLGQQNREMKWCKGPFFYIYKALNVFVPETCSFLTSIG